MQFHGDLLIGGMSLKDLDGDVDEDTSEHPGSFSGRFTIEADRQDVLETGRPYRLMLDDGRAGQVIVSRIEPTNDNHQLLVEFEGTSPLEPSRNPLAAS